MSKPDNQVVEVLGRNLLTNKLLKMGFEVAFPTRDKYIDLIIYRNIGRKFIARPVQLKAASIKSFSIDKKYSKVPGLLIVYVWGCNGEDEEVIYAMTYRESVNSFKKWAPDDALRFWKTRGLYSRTSPSNEIIKSMERYKMESKKDWIKKIKGN